MKKVFSLIRKSVFLEIICPNFKIFTGPNVQRVRNLLKTLHAKVRVIIFKNKEFIKKFFMRLKKSIKFFCIKFNCSFKSNFIIYQRAQKNFFIVSNSIFVIGFSDLTGLLKETLVDFKIFFLWRNQRKTIRLILLMISLEASLQKFNII